MVSWLRRVLAANLKTCTVAYFNHPLFGSGRYGNQSQVRSVWDVLYTANADVVVGGGDHDYERIAPQRPDRTRDASREIREFIIGTAVPTTPHLGPSSSTARRVTPTSTGC